MLTRPLYFASLLALALPACAGQTDAAFDDASIDDDAKADRAGGGSSYYLVRSDAKGNSYVKRVNFSTTTCTDGRSASECCVAAVDYSTAKLEARPTWRRRHRGHADDRARRSRRSTASPPAKCGSPPSAPRRQRLRHRQRRRLSRQGQRRPLHHLAVPTAIARPRSTARRSRHRRRRSVAGRRHRRPDLRCVHGDDRRDGASSTGTT